MKLLKQTLLLSVAVCIAVGGAAEATTHTYIGPDHGAWNVDEYWDYGSVPGPSSDVLIPSGKHVGIMPNNDHPMAYAGTLVVESEADVEVSPASDRHGILHLGGVNTFMNPTEHTIDGAIILEQHNGDYVSKLTFAPTHHVFLGSGKVQGRDDASEMYLTELENHITIQGNLQIIHGTLIHEGLILADADGGTLLVEPYELGDADNSSTSPLAPEYEAENNGTLEFGSGIGVITDDHLNGDFAVGLQEAFATLLINHAITSTGHLEMDEGLTMVNQNFFLGSSGTSSSARFLLFKLGTIDVAPGSKFTHE